MDAVLTTMVEDKIGPGERSRLLLQTAKEYLHFDYALSLRSPAIALMLALRALNPERGQGVIISALSPRYYVNVIKDMGLCPMFCDVSLTFPCMSREAVEQTLAEKAQTAVCIVLHHTLGFLPDTASIAALGLPVIEDISQSFNVAFGADNDKKSQPDNEPVKERAHGVFTILGLEERDMLTCGGGALLCANNRRDGAMLRNFGELPPEFCLPDINAALAVVQFRESRRNIEKRSSISQVYVQSSLRTHHKRFIPLNDCEYNNFAFPLVLETGLKDVLAYARKKDIVLENAFENTIAAAGSGEIDKCPVSYSLSLRTVLFPLYPRLRSTEIERVSKLIAAIP